LIKGKDSVLFRGSAYKKTNLQRERFFHFVACSFRFGYNPVMKLPWYLALILICAACTPLAMPGSNPAGATSSAATIVATQRYTVHQRITLANTGDRPPAKQNLWVALIRDLSPYQEVLSRKISPNKYILSTDEYGNQYAEFDLSDHPAGTTISIEIAYEVSVNEISYDLSSCEGALISEFTKPELHIESANAQIVSLAEELSKGKRTACEQLRAFYDYAGDELLYSYNRRAWGAQATFGLMGADCTEYASLVIALSRAEAIPARYYEGLLYLEGNGGDKDEQIAQTEHAWLDAYLPGAGWTALDPTLGRWPVNRETYFARYTPNHIIVTTGRNPSTLRGASYWSHLYWPGNLTSIQVSDATWDIRPAEAR
jgi:transglutaminase-like putative cysteine protease